MYFLSRLIFFLYLFWRYCNTYVFYNSIWGSRSRKIYASYQFFVYTLLGSIFVLLAFSISFFIADPLLWFFYKYLFLESREFFFFIFMFFGFASRYQCYQFIFDCQRHICWSAYARFSNTCWYFVKMGSYAMLKLLLISFSTLYNDRFFLFLYWHL